MHGDAFDQPGATRRGYRIERLIGRGSAAAVYEARWLGPNGPGERVACKVMHVEQRDAPGFRRLVWHEAVVGLRFTAGHPNLTQVLDFFDDAQEQLCIVMELVDGASLEELRAPGQRWPFPIARRVAIEVLEALVHLHGRNVLYRDLSMHNILVTAGGAVKVTDFGIARVMEQGQVRTSEIRGTPVYLSPEAIEGRALDARSDLFSLGAVLYDLVAGVPPCGNHEMRGAVFARTLYGKFEPLPPDTPADLTELITGLLQIDRDARRPQTAAEALALLRGHGQPLASPEDLAALVGPAQARRDQALAGKRPANVLPAGYVLAPRDDRHQTERTARKPSVRVAGGAAQALPARAAEKDAMALPEHVAESDPRALPERVVTSEVEVLPAREVASAAGASSPDADGFQANLLSDLVAYFGADQMAKIIDGLPANPSPGLLIELESNGAPTSQPNARRFAFDAVPEHIDDALPNALIDRVSASVPDPPGDALPDRVAEGASSGTLHWRSRLARCFVARRVVLTAAIGMCVLVLGSLLDDGFRREQDTSALTSPTEVATPARVLGPPAPATPAEPLRGMDRADDLRRRQLESRSRRAGRPRLRREYVPPGSGPPPWGQQ
jgi:predicted Ser/Thr protein kinase